MKIIIIEDDPIKLNSLTEFLKLHFPNSIIDKAISYMSGINTIIDNEYDVILLDMSIPLYDDIFNVYVPKNFGGKDILREMKRYKVNSKVLVITQYDEFDDGNISMVELDKELKGLYSNIYFGYVKYAFDDISWHDKLINYIKSII